MANPEADKTEQLEVLILGTDTPDITILNMTKKEIDEKLRGVMHDRRNYDYSPDRKYN